MVWGSIYKTTFSGIFWVLPNDYNLYTKKIPKIFVYLFICKVTTIKFNFRFCKQCSHSASPLVFKPLSYCFEETIGFDVKASFARRLVSRLIKPGDITKEF